MLRGIRDFLGRSEKRQGSHGKVDRQELPSVQRPSKSASSGKPPEISPEELQRITFEVRRERFGGKAITPLTKGTYVQPHTPGNVTGMYNVPLSGGEVAGPVKRGEPLPPEQFGRRKKKEQK